jgi:hypothetical protein
MFRRNILPSSSESNKPSKMPAWKQFLLVFPPNFTLVSCLAYSIRCSEASVDCQRTTLRYIPVLIQFWHGSKFFLCFINEHNGVVRLSPVGTSATDWTIVPAPDNRWWVWSIWWNEIWQGKPKYSEKTCLSATLSATNRTWLDLGSNPGRRSDKSALLNPC